MNEEKLIMSIENVDEESLSKKYFNDFYNDFLQTQTGVIVEPLITNENGIRIKGRVDNRIEIFNEPMGREGRVMINQVSSNGNVQRGICYLEGNNWIWED